MKERLNKGQDTHTKTEEKPKQTKGRKKYKKHQRQEQLKMESTVKATKSKVRTQGNVEAGANVLKKS